MPLPTAPSRGAVRRLSYAVTPDFSRCPVSSSMPGFLPNWTASRQSHSRAISGALSLRLGQVSCSCDTRHRRDLTFTRFRQLEGTARISSRCPCPCRPICKELLTCSAGNESSRGISPPALNVAWRASLQAPRFTGLTRIGIRAMEQHRSGESVSSAWQANRHDAL
jgi:hypothetical protein